VGRPWDRKEDGSPISASHGTGAGRRG
jgi:hypothetical protein